MAQPTPAAIMAEMTRQDIAQQLETAPILVTYARHRAHTTLLSLVLQTTQRTVYSYQLTAEDTHLAALLEHLVADTQFPAAFGRQTRAALTSSEAPEDWAAAFGADLAALGEEDHLLILDEWDRLAGDRDRIDRFWRELLQYLPSTAQHPCQWPRTTAPALE